MASSILNFDEDRLITGVNIIDGMLFFTDNNSEPKKIDIESFKNADHSTGTTNIYGRRFQERDITVIRPAPLDTLRTSISTIDPENSEISPYAEVATVETIRASEETTTSAKIFGKAISAHASLSSTGFYYVQSDTLPSRIQMSNGTRVLANSYSNGNFSSTIDGLTANTRYYFVAFAFNNINAEVIADSILTFKTEKATASKTAPVVKTENPLPIGNAKYKLRGTITDNGGSTIRQAKFYIKKFNLLDGIVEPSTLVGYSGATVIDVTGSIDPSTGKYFYDIIVPEYFYAEFYAANDIGNDVGGVVGGLVVTGESSQLKPEVRYVTYTNLSDNSINLRITGQITRQNGQVSERGFYLSKTQPRISEFYYTHQSDANLFKVPVAMDLLTAEEEFSLDTFTVNGLSLSVGDTLYVAVYADNGIHGVTTTVPISIGSSETSIQKPGVITLPPNKFISGSDTQLKVGTHVTYNGYNDLTSGLGYQNGVSSMGVIIYGSAFGELDGKTNEQKEEILLGHLSDQKAVKVIFKRQTAISQVFGTGETVNVTETGIDVYQIFKHDNPTVPLDENREYHVMSFASNGTEEGYGNTISVKFHPTADIVPKFRTFKVTRNSSNNNLIFYGKLDSFEADQPDIVDAGFAYSVSATLANFDIDTAARASLGSLPSGASAKEGSSIAKLNAHINGTTPAQSVWAIEIPHTSLQAGSSGLVQAWVQVESGGVKHGAKYELNGVNIQDGIIDFTNYEAAEPAAVAPTVILNDPPTSDVDVNFGVSGRVTTGHSSIKLNDLFEDSAAGLYYAKTSDISGDVETYLLANGDQANILFNIFTLPDTAKTFSYAFGGTTDDGGVFLNQNNVLVVNTSYKLIAKVVNSAGSATSNIIQFTTKPSAAYIIEAKLAPVQTRSESIHINYRLSGHGNRNRSYHRLYYIKSSDFTGTTAAELVADPDASYLDGANFSGTYNQGTQGGRTIEDLEPGTEYKFVWEFNFDEVGIKRSNVVTETTKGGIPYVPPATISVGATSLYFDFFGNEIPNRSDLGVLDHQRPLNSVPIYVTPTGSSWSWKPGSGDWSKMTVRKQTVSGIEYLVFLPNKNTEWRGRDWDVDVYNTADPANIINIVLEQEASETGDQDDWYYGPNDPYSNMDYSATSGFNGYGSEPNNNSDKLPYDGTPGSNQILFEEGNLDKLGNPKWDNAPF